MGSLSKAKVRSILRVCSLVALLAATSALPRPIVAQAPEQTGLVVVLGDGRTEARCVPLQQDRNSGDQILARSGLDTVVDVSSGMGVTVCRIEGVGCAFPSEHCFCQCMGGGDCAYWNYFYREPGDAEWTYSALGAAMREAKAGGVEGWVWGDGQAPPPDKFTFAAICASPTPAPTSTAAPPAPGATVVAAAATEVNRPTATAQASTVLAPATKAPTEAPSPTPSAGTGPGGSNYWFFVLMAAGLIAAGIWVWRRHTG